MEIAIVAFLGIWLSGAAFFSYRFLKKECEEEEKNEKKQA